MRILVGLLEHMGDIVACEPVARYLKANHPNAHLSWAVSPRYRELVDTNPYVDETVVLECLTDWIKFTKHKAYDRIVDLHVNYRICEHCGIPLVKSTGNPFVSVHEWFDYGSLQQAFTVGAGLPSLSAQPQLCIKEEHKYAIDRLNLPSDFCVFHVQSHDRTKDWKRVSWVKLCKLVSDSIGIPIVEVGGGPNHIPLSRPGIIDLVNRLPILQTAEVIRRARFFVGVDSGPAHLANALMVPGAVLLGRMGYFREYMPFSGFFASKLPQVKMIRNLTGPAFELPVAEVCEAVEYLAAVSEGYVKPSELDASGTPSSLNVIRPGASARHAADREEVLTSGLFDTGWYTVHDPEVARSGIDPVDHYLANGAITRASPGPEFDASQYLAANPDVISAGVNPLLHYLRYGRHEKWRRHKALRRSADRFLPDLRASVSNLESSSASTGTGSQVSDLFLVPKRDVADSHFPRTLAFYLPQFHPIQENDWAHGRGFSEWHNVIKAKPLFKGHYQPRMPGELGFYDLRSIDVLRQQVTLAHEHGISGFCFYYYYFHGKRLLYKPIENLVGSDIEFPFCVVWANENWSKRWDGGDRDLIIEQRHSPEDDLLFIQQLFPIFKDHRYITVKGKPLLLVYKAHLFPNISHTTELWRKEAKSQGLAGLYLVLVDDWTPDPVHPRQYGFDASYEIPSNLVPEAVRCLDTDCLEVEESFAGKIVDYRKFAAFHMSRPFPEYKRFRTVMLPWDNTARYGSRAIVHVNGAGEAYRLWLIEALLDTYRRYPPDERIVFIHSWNEWCEGTHLEPDARYGRKFLEQTKEAIGVVNVAIQLSNDSPNNVSVISELLSLMQRKEGGRFYAIRGARMQLASVWKALEGLRTKARGLQWSSSTFKAENERLRAMHDAAASQRDDLERKLVQTRNRLEQERDDLQRGRERLQQELEQVRAEVASLRGSSSELDAVYASSSWRMTAPVRAAAKLLLRR